MRLDTLPPQPDEASWGFVNELRTVPYHHRVVWTPRAAAPGEADLRAGVRLEANFPDPDARLATAYADFGYFLSCVGLADDGPYPLRCVADGRLGREEHRLTVRADGCELAAADTDGIRRGLVWLEDELLRRGGPFLPLGTQRRRPLVRTRISRCFYGPINRPPKSKDELTDDVDYYPDEYLNRLAHEGVNVLWLTIKWYETIPSQLIPEYGRNAAPRLAKLRRTVDKCARYGIRIYPFCIEPAALATPDPAVAAAAAAHPELRGHGGSFCTGTELGRAYVEEAVRTLFSEVPGLGGLIVIPVGERQTHCYSGAIPDGGMWPTANTCPRCAQRRPYEVLADTLAAMRSGMDAVAPEAELVAWPYGQFIAWGPDRTAEAAAHMPPGVILQHNFETGGSNRQLGKDWPTWDYWLSYCGPSDLFRRSAEAAVPTGVRMSAKLQVGCSHEVATCQVVPAPGLLHRKYSAMHQLGVSSAMHSWYFGSYPSLMTKAAGELSFAPFPSSNRRFLRSLAQRDWGAHAEAVVTAWEWFQKGYSNYPTTHIFGYFGPMHDGPAWPLHLEPRRRPLAPTWQIGYEPSGDYVAECVCNGFTLDEVVELCRRMDRDWAKGVAILKGLRPAFADCPERLRDIGVATALGLQFHSGHSILRFYLLRERLAEAKSPALRHRLLDQMEAIARDELAVSAELLPLAEADSCLGFHSEAEGYKYHPALLRWRMEQLQELLRDEFAAVRERAGRRRPLFGAYTGEEPDGPVQQSCFVATAPSLDTAPAGGPWAAAPKAVCDDWLRSVFNPERRKRCGYDPNDNLPVSAAEHQGRSTTWQALHTAEALYLAITCTTNSLAGEGLQVFIEPRRTQPRRIFHLSPGGTVRCQRDDGYLPERGATWQAATFTDADGWSALLRVPFEWLGWSGPKRPPLRVNVVRGLPTGEPGAASVSWAKREPVRGRLVWSVLNPATDFGWLRFGDPTG